MHKVVHIIQINFAAMELSRRNASITDLGNSSYSDCYESPKVPTKYSNITSLTTAHCQSQVGGTNKMQLSHHHHIAISLTKNSTVLITKAFILKFFSEDEESCFKRLIFQVNLQSTNNPKKRPASNFQLQIIGYNFLEQMFFAQLFCFPRFIKGKTMGE